MDKIRNIVPPKEKLVPPLDESERAKADPKQEKGTKERQDQVTITEKGNDEDKKPEQENARQDQEHKVYNKNAYTEKIGNQDTDIDEVV